MRALMLAAVLAASPVVPASAQAPCMPHAQMAELLGARFGEVRIAVAIQANGAMIEVFVNPDTRSWTVVMTQPGGPACAVAAGEAWEDVARLEGTAL